MGIMGYLRERMGKILAICIGFSLLAFILGEVVRSGGSFFREDRTSLGEVGGEKIAYDDFTKKVEQNSAQFRQQSGQGALSPQILSYVQETTWNNMVTQAVMQKEFDKLGLAVGDDEAQSMVSGNSPNQEIVRAFSDPKTGQFDRSRLNGFLQQLPTLKPEIQTQWSEFITELIQSKLSEKYVALVSNSLYVNSLEVKDDYQDKNRIANFKYVLLNYNTLPDNKVTVTDEDYQAYYDDHKAQYKTPSELRTFDFVSFNAAPSKADTAAIEKEAEKMAADFKASTNDSLFVQINAETKAPLTYQHKAKGRAGNPKVDSIMFNSPNGTVYGPYLQNGSYKISKLVDAHIEPDSAKARHILIDDKTIGNDKALAKADSLKKLIEGGKSFADLAKTFSIDGSASKGGDLGTFGRGAMVAPFEDAVFSGKKGDLKIVTSQFGVHLIEIEDLKGSSKVAKVATVDIPLKASSTTETAVYSKAQAFLASLTKDNFDEQVKKAGLKKQTATDVSGIAASVSGIPSARDLVRWAYGAEKKDFSDKVYIEGDQYIIAQLVQIKPKGTLSLEDVKKQIQPLVLNEVKGKLLSAKLQSALSGSSTIDQVAQKSATKVVPIQNIVFANPVIPGSSAEYKLIGTVFGSQPNKLSKPIAGAQGVYVFDLDSFTNPPALNNAVREKQQLAQALAQRAESEIFDALKEKASIIDNRAKFL